MIDESGFGSGTPIDYTRYGGDYVAYEYLTVQADRDLEPLYKDTYRSFGWIIENTTTGVLAGGAPNPTTVTLKLKRDRRIRNRPLVNELQRKAESAMEAIHDLENSRTSTALAVALAIGIVGSAFLAGSVFAIEAGLWVLSIPLGAVGLLGWLAGYLAHGRIKARKTTQTAPLIDEQYEIIYDASEQAARLLA
ncbi:hypothetical protein GCM10009785_21940 [Brooklawnia cerclae]|uniref:Uncharacterized protein n=1 Tax=Brooklawnia cerclae TaxID=349934 RepID=A0ABX0SIM2_9ACTN|nr:hypothetical protein [Brooklawnia cerclae]NIH57173.1 hypothetical protein [Brooklawnia cerclae]